MPGRHALGALCLDPARVHPYQAVSTRASPRRLQRIDVRRVQADFRHRDRRGRWSFGETMLPLRVPELLDPGRLPN
jgi:hypothetical protein